MAEKKTNGTNRVHKGRTTLAYVVLIILSFLCLFLLCIAGQCDKESFPDPEGLLVRPGKIFGSESESGSESCQHSGSFRN